MLNCLSREQILGADDLPRREVPVPEWGGVVYVQTLDVLACMAAGAEIDAAGGDLEPRFRALGRLLVKVLVDGRGNRLLQDGDAEALLAKNPEVFLRLVKAAEEVNGRRADAADDAEKNSGPTPDSPGSCSTPGGAAAA